MLVDLLDVCTLVRVIIVKHIVCFFGSNFWIIASRCSLRGNEELGQWDERG